MKILIFLFILSNFSMASLFESTIGNTRCERDNWRCQSSYFKRKGLGSFAIMQGHTTSTTTQIIFLLPKRSRSLTFRVISESGKEAQIKRHIIRSKSFSEWTVQRVDLDGLLEKNYKFQIVQNNTVLDERQFSTLESQGTKLKFAVVSCLDDRYDLEQQKMWAQVLSKKPETIFMIGDNVYADHLLWSLIYWDADEKQLWLRYLDTRLSLRIFREETLVPIYATWDDHDYGVNNGGKSHEHKEDALDIFQTFFAQDLERNIINGPGLSYALNLRGHRFFFFDNRSFRDSNEDTSGAQLGDDILSWYSKHTTNRPSYLIQGDQFFGAYQPFESYERQHPEEFEKFLGITKDSKAASIFISGDRHLSELMKVEKDLLGYETFEFTTSGLHAKMYPGSHQKYPNKRRIAGVDGELNYGIITSEVIDNGMSVIIETFGDNKLLFKNILSIQNK